MNNSTIRRMVTTAFVGMLGIGSLFAQPDGRARDKVEGMRDRMEEMKDAFAELDLTDRQKGQIAQLQEEFKAENEGTLEEIRELGRKAREQMQSGDEEGAAATREEIEAKSRELRENARELREQIGMILTDEQKAQLMEMHGSHEAHGRPGDCPEKGEILEKLGLTDAQKEEIKVLRDQFKEENSETLDRMKELGRRMREQMRNGDREGAQATREEMKALREEIAAAAEELREQIGSVLTDEQKALLEEHRDELLDCRAEHRRERKERKGRGEHAPEIEEEAPADIR